MSDVLFEAYRLVLSGHSVEDAAVLTARNPEDIAALLDSGEARSLRRLFAVVDTYCQHLDMDALCLKSLDSLDRAISDTKSSVSTIIQTADLILELKRRIDENRVR